MATVARVSTRNAAFQEWHALLTNRNKRQRSGEFLVHGVRPMMLAAGNGWRFTALLYAADRTLSHWATHFLAGTPARQYAVSDELLAELGEKDGAAPELLAVVAMPSDDLARIPLAYPFLGVALDRPGSPGNLGSIVRSADAFGASGVIVSGHAADPYDPKAVRASTGSLFTVPTVRAASGSAVVDWAAAHHMTIVAADERGEVDAADHDLTAPTLLVIGNETTGLSNAWLAACDAVVRIPIGGSASSLNAANAASILLYEAARQRAARG